MTEPFSIPTDYMFDQFQQGFDLVSFRTSRPPLSEDNPVMHLLVGPEYYYTGPEEFDVNQPIFVDLVYTNDVLASLQEAPNPHSDTLQLTVMLPVFVQAEHVLETARLLATFNVLLPLGNLTFNAKHQVYFRYGLKAERRDDIEPLLLVKVIRLVNFFMQSMARRIAAVAQGHMTSAAALQDLSAEYDQQAQEAIKAAGEASAG